MRTALEMGCDIYASHVTFGDDGGDYFSGILDDLWDILKENADEGHEFITIQDAQYY